MSSKPKEEEEAKLLELRSVLLAVVDEILRKITSVGKEMISVNSIDGIVARERIAKVIIEIKKVAFQVIYNPYKRFSTSIPKEVSNTSPHFKPMKLPVQLKVPVSRYSHRSKTACFQEGHGL